MLTPGSASLRDKFDRFPVETRQTIEKAITNQMVPIRESFGNQNEALQQEILNLKDQLVKTNEDRLNTEHEINQLNSKIRQHKVFEEVKRKELELMMFEKRNQHIGGNKNRTEIPDLPYHKFEFPKMPRNFEQRIKNKVAERGIQREAPMLYSKHSHMRIPRGCDAHGDGFGAERMKTVLKDRNRAENYQFYEPEKMAIKMSSAGRSYSAHAKNDLFSIEDDFLNRQNIIMPRFKSDMMDEDRHVIDVFNNNEERLKALEDPDSKENARIRNQLKEGQSQRNRTDFLKVDKIIEELDSFKDKYFDDKQHERVLRRDLEMEGDEPSE